MENVKWVFKKGIVVGFTTFSAIKVTRYLCGNCGYLEEWIDNKQDVEKLRENISNPFHLPLINAILQ